MEKWNDDECVNFECAREAITHARAYLEHLRYEESRKDRPDPEVLSRLNAECSRLFQERKNLRVKDHAEIARIRTEYGAFIRSARVDRPKAERLLKPNPDRYRLGEAEHQDIFEQRIIPDLFADITPSDRPVAVIFGGQPGAGKSAAVDGAACELGPLGGACQILGDDLRDRHPHYFTLTLSDDRTAAFHTDRDTALWVEKAIAEAKKRRVNVVIEGTMRDAGKVAATMLNLREAGHMIDARVLAVPYRLSGLGIMRRYERQRADRGAGRMTTPEAHQAAYDGMLATLDLIEAEKLADRLTIFRRDQEVLYRNELQSGRWAREPRARAVVEAERARPMTVDERENYVKGLNELADTLASPQRGAGDEERREVADMLLQAEAAMNSEILRLADVDAKKEL